MQTRDMVVAVFDDRDDAQDAIHALRDAGFDAENISFLARDRDTAGRLADDTGTEMAAGAATGALAGGLLGGVAGWLVGIGALAIPGVGPIIAAGPIAAALGGAALGAAGGGTIGALTGAGVPEDEARYYDEEFKRGGIVVTVHAAGRYTEAESILREYGGRDATTASATSYGTWHASSPGFRSSYEQRYGTDRRWEDVEPAHRFGYESYGQARQGDALPSFEVAEPGLRESWSRTNRGDYDAQRSDIRRGWDYGRGRTRFRDDSNDFGAGGRIPASRGGGVVTRAETGGATRMMNPRERSQDVPDDRQDRMEDGPKRR